MNKEQELEYELIKEKFNSFIEKEIPLDSTWTWKIKNGAIVLELEICLNE